MDKSVFSKIYTYRQRENKDSKENYLTEIFAHCLRTDKKILDEFLNKLDLQSDDKTKIETQNIYSFGIPDIEINIPSTKTCILIECKVEHFERQNQLDDYKKILHHKKISKGHLVFLTKYYTFREDDDEFVKLHLLKWSDISQIIDGKCSQLSNEFKLFIKNENMEQTKNFNYTDLSVLTNISNSISKMDEVIDSVSEYYKDKIGHLSKKASRSTKIENEEYATYHFAEVRNEFKSQIEIGFFWWEGAEVFVGVSIWFSLSENYKGAENHINFAKKTLKGWDKEKYEDDCFIIDRLKVVSEFINNEDDQIPVIAEFLRKCIDDLALLKKVDPKIFK